MTQTNWSTKRKQTHRHRKQICDGKSVGKGNGGGRIMQCEVWVSKCKLLYIEWINNKVLLYITRNYTEYPVINHNGRDYKKNVYTHITELLFCRAEINTTLQINYTSTNINKYVLYQSSSEATENQCRLSVFFEKILVSVLFFNRYSTIKLLFFLERDMVNCIIYYLFILLHFPIWSKLSNLLA